jgi:hypothetical protein
LVSDRNVVPIVGCRAADEAGRMRRQKQCRARKLWALDLTNRVMDETMKKSLSAGAGFLPPIPLKYGVIAEEIDAVANGEIAMKREAMRANLDLNAQRTESHDEVRVILAMHALRPPTNQI